MDNSRISYYDVEETDGGGTPEPFLSYESEYTYDMHGNVKGEKDYEVDGQIRTLLQAKRYTYNTRGLLASESTVPGPDEPSASDHSDHEITYTYDSKGNLTGADYAFRNGNVKGAWKRSRNDIPIREITSCRRTYRRSM